MESVTLGQGLDSWVLIPSSQMVLTAPPHGERNRILELTKRPSPEQYFK